MMSTATPYNTLFSHLVGYFFLFLHPRSSSPTSARQIMVFFTTKKNKIGSPSQIKSTCDSEIESLEFVVILPRK